MKNDHLPLTPKQLIVLQLSAQGYAGKEIADKLGIGLKSVISRKHQVFKKLGARSAAHAVNIAWERGILKANHSSSINLK